MHNRRIAHQFRNAEHSRGHRSYTSIFEVLRRPHGVFRNDSAGTGRRPPVTGGGPKDKYSSSPRQIKTICLTRSSREKPQRESMAEQDFKTTRNPGAEWRNESGDGPHSMTIGAPRRAHPTQNPPCPHGARTPVSSRAAFPCGPGPVRRPPRPRRREEFPEPVYFRSR